MKTHDSPKRSMSKQKSDPMIPLRGPCFDADFRKQLSELLVWRRDVRRFRLDPLPADTLGRLIQLASLSPSVGLSQPVRFVLVDDPARRRAVLQNFEECNAEALSALSSDRADHYARLKLSGLKEAPCQLGVFADRSTRQGHGLGRRTMPETIEYSAVVAIHTLWLAARAEGIGLGWVSILDPRQISSTLDVPEHWSFVAYLCLGYPQQMDDVPELAREGWDQRRQPDSLLIRR
jgi:5,6-dimethylbenzimidazole synthase